MSKRPSRTQAGYGYEHQRLRAAYARRIEHGEQFTCAKCGHAVARGMDWHLGHTDDRRGYTGPEHATCNVRDGASRGGQRLAAKRKALRATDTPQRAW